MSTGTPPTDRSGGEAATTTTWQATTRPRQSSGRTRRRHERQRLGAGGDRDHHGLRRADDHALGLQHELEQQHHAGTSVRSRTTAASSPSRANTPVTPEPGEQRVEPADPLRDGNVVEHRGAVRRGHRQYDTDGASRRNSTANHPTAARASTTSTAPVIRRQPCAVPDGADHLHDRRDQAEHADPLQHLELAQGRLRDVLQAHDGQDRDGPAGEGEHGADGGDLRQDAGHPAVAPDAAARRRPAGNACGSGGGSRRPATRRTVSSRIEDGRAEHREHQAGARAAGTGSRANARLEPDRLDPVVGDPHRDRALPADLAPDPGRDLLVQGGRHGSRGRA